MAAPTTDKTGTIVVSALNVLASFGELLDRVSDECSNDSRACAESGPCTDCEMKAASEKPHSHHVVGRTYLFFGMFSANRSRTRRMRGPTGSTSDFLLVPFDTIC